VASRRSSRLSLAVALALLLAGVGLGATDGIHDAATCRNLATELTARVTAAGGFTATIKTSCTFNQSLKEGTCSVQYSDSQGTKTTSETTTKYASIADIVDEIAVIPPLIYARSTTGKMSGNRGTTAGTSTNSFDTSRRITRTVNESAMGTSTTTYSDWDAAGRPTRASDVGRGFSNTRSISYDDAARTRTTIVNGGQLRTMETFDADGNQIAATTTAAGATVATKTDVTVAASQRLCK
jgi:hypothetical protein